MTLRQLPRLSRLLNRKPPGSIGALQILKPIDRNSRSSRRELQQSALLLGVPAANALPEVLDDLVVLGVPSVIGVLLPVLDVDVGDTTDEEFEFALVEDVYEIRGDELVEAGDEGVELFRDALLDAPLRDKTVTRMLVAGCSRLMRMIHTQCTPSCSRSSPQCSDRSPLDQS